MADGSLGEYLRERPDGCYETEALLDQGVTAAPHQRLEEFVRAVGQVDILLRNHQRVPG